MAYIGKVTNNIDGAIIHSKFSMPFKCKKFPSLNLEQLQLIMLDENSIIKKKNKLIDFQLRSNINCIHTIVFENFDVINIGDIYQVQLCKSFQN